MTEANAKTPLFPGFEPVSAEAWEARIRKDLRDVPYQSLFWKAEDGLTVKPFYTKADLPENRTQKPDDFPYERTARTRDNCWENIQTIYVRKDSRPFIDKGITALQRGADGLHFVLRESLDFDFVYLLGQPGVQGSAISFTFPVSPETYLHQYLQAARDLNIDLNLLKGFIQFEPIDDQPFGFPPYAAIPKMLELVKDAPNLYPVTISGHQFSNKGASVSQEIAIALSAAVSVLDCAEKAGVPAEKVIGHIQMHLAAGTNYFFEIAKLRALRLLWSALVNSYGLAGELASRLRVHSSTSRWYQTVFDPHVNLLRTTTEAMSAILGGSDSISVAPFDKIYKTPDDFSERIARNISVILKEESYLDKAIDPAAGSYYLEALTKELAENAWQIFQTLESKGGFRKALESGFIAAEIKKVTEEKFRAYTIRENILVGTNKYPNLHEKVDFDPEQLMQSKYFDTSRAAYPFEIMRLASELHFRKKQKKARAVIAVIGTKITEHLHASFAKEFFDCANFETHVFHFETIEAALNVLQNDAAKVVVLSGSDEQYQYFDQALTTRIKNHAHKPILILAATPQHMEEEMMSKGFDQYIFQGCNMDSIISCIQQKMVHEENPLD
ncbi:methylmalonyl-CoA mutase family protein [Adhaeribacter soli]|uniref:Methylmalonyl-CoA mutase n=1 Tax=Adhaeribacter soli TaxID=2607655 RepID=A0A5N1J6I5_9BACT|nr:methylmalonyl-CoA mutase family protein [Adhaeribacter soli]KAA9340807.1 methylmalonyl-CoA mutase [Adhaeribacter soli]